MKVSQVVRIVGPETFITLEVAITFVGVDPRTMSDAEKTIAQRETEHAIIRMFGEVQYKHRCIKCGPVPPDKVYEAEGGGFGHSGCWQKVKVAR